MIEEKSDLILDIILSIGSLILLNFGLKTFIDFFFSLVMRWGG